MKRFLRYIPVFLVCLILVVTPVLMSVSASAQGFFVSEDNVYTFYPAIPSGSYDSDGFFPGFDGRDLLSHDLKVRGVIELDSGELFSIDFYLAFYSPDYLQFDSDYNDYQAAYSIQISTPNATGSSDWYYFISYNSDVPKIVSISFIFPPSSGSGVSSVGIYGNLFNLVHTYIYGGVEMTSDMNLVCTIVATAGCIFVFALPFFVVWFLIKLIGGR